MKNYFIFSLCSLTLCAPNNKTELDLKTNILPLNSTKKDEIINKRNNIPPLNFLNNHFGIPWNNFIKPPFNNIKKNKTHCGKPKKKVPPSPPFVNPPIPPVVNPPTPPVVNPKLPEYPISKIRFDIYEMLRQVNQVRKRHNTKLRMLTIHPSLMESSKVQSDYQARIRSSQHEGPGGNNAGQRITNAGYKISYSGGRAAWAENVAWGQRSVSEVMKSWIGSPGHYNNIVNSNFIHFGAAWTGQYWTQNFARDR